MIHRFTKSQSSKPIHNTTLQLKIHGSTNNTLFNIDTSLQMCWTCLHITVTILRFQVDLPDSSWTNFSNIPRQPESALLQPTVPLNSVWNYVLPLSSVNVSECSTSKPVIFISPEASPLKKYHLRLQIVFGIPQLPLSQVCHSLSQRNAVH